MATSKDEQMKEMWAQICDNELLDEVPEIEYAPLTSTITTEYTIQDKEQYMEQALKDRQTSYEELYKVVIRITPQENSETPRVVDVRGILISSQVTKAICSLCATFESLKVLRLINCNLKSESMYLLSNTLGTTNVTYLYLDKNPLPDQNYHIVLNSNFVLQHLSLRVCRIDEIGARNLSLGLMYANPEHQRLRSLNLNGNLIDCKGAEAIAKSLRWNRTLVYLSMAGNRIGDKGAKAIAEALLPFQLTYEELVFRSQRITDRLKSVRKNMYEHNVSATPKKKTQKKDKDTTADEEAYLTQKRSEIAESIAYFGQLIKSADESTPLDTHPLISEVEEYDDEFWTKGNDVLFSLNISYNQITLDGIAHFLEVAKYQDMYLTNSRGLSRLNYEGNQIEDKQGFIVSGLNNFFSGKRSSIPNKSSKRNSKN